MVAGVHETVTILSGSKRIENRDAYIVDIM
jgi:hypothetical protein